MLTAKNSLSIPALLKTVWDKLTEANSKQTWVDNDGGYFISSWKAGELITHKGSDNEDISRGRIIQREEHKTIMFSLHDAFEEDNADSEYTEELLEDVWIISFEERGDETLVGIAISDYDKEHDTDDLHDHADAIKTQQDVETKIIPEMLERIKALF